MAHAIDTAASGIGDWLRTHRTAIGSPIEVTARTDGRTPRVLVRELGVMGGSSAQADPRVHAGLGAHRGPERVAVFWYGATPERWRLAPDRYHVLRQGEGRAASPEEVQP